MFRVLRAGSISSHGMRILSSFSETSPVFKKYKGGLGEKNASKVSSSLVAKCGLYLQSHFYTSVVSTDTNINNNNIIIIACDQGRGYYYFKNPNNNWGEWAGPDHCRLKFGCIY